MIAQATRAVRLAAATVTTRNGFGMILTYLALVSAAVSGTLALAALLETARKPTVTLWAEGPPKALKDLLKARRYRWSPTRRT